MNSACKIFILLGICSLSFVFFNFVLAEVPSNRPPVLEPIGNKTIEVGQEFAFVVYAQDLDGDYVSYSLSLLPSGATFREFQGVGKIYYIFRWTPEFTQRGTRSITFFAEDPSGAADLETIELGVMEATPDKDVVAPFVSDVTLIDRTGNSAIISWSTNELAVGRIEYGISAVYGELTSFTDDFAREIRQTIKNLKPGTLYRYRVAAKDKAGNQSFSGEKSFSTVSLETIAESELRLRIANLKLARAEGDTRVYYITDRGLKKWIRNAEIFRSYKNNKWENIVVVSPGGLDIYPEVSLIRQVDDKKVYKLEGNVKRWIKTAAAFARLGYDWNNILSINKTEFDFYAEDPPIE
ncbi:MAG: fibronectin type III domain-containing protein [Candidatus Spechtbacterales bacterium]